MTQKPTSVALVGIVGPCGAGKTTLAHALKNAGIRARQIAQEHSYVPKMWSVLTHPDILVYLHASFDVCTERKQFRWTPQEYEEQLARLKDARSHCDIFVDTDSISPGEVLAAVLSAMEGPRN